nr:MAG TPA: hypothetical protein [Caudoviricetes sp.]
MLFITELIEDLGEAYMPTSLQQSDARSTGMCFV